MIRAQYAGGARSVELAAQYGISDVSIRNVVARRTWERVT